MIAEQVPFAPTVVGGGEGAGGWGGEGRGIKPALLCVGSTHLPSGRHHCWCMYQLSLRQGRKVGLAS